MLSKIKAKLKRFGSLRAAKTLVALALLIGMGQQCSRVELEEFQEYSLASKSFSNPLRLEPPSDFQAQRRLILLVDMSNSMLSGSCPQDVDGGMLYENKAPFTVWDPNKNAGNYADHRGSGVDCRVNSALPIARSSVTFTVPDLLANPPLFYETSFGVDPERDRVEIVRRWITGAIEAGTPQARANTKVLLIPVTGGRSQTSMMKDYPLGIEFVTLEDPRLTTAIQFLIAEHDRHKEVLQSTNMFRYQTTAWARRRPARCSPRSLRS